MMGNGVLDDDGFMRYSEGLLREPHVLAVVGSKDTFNAKKEFLDKKYR